MSQEEEPFLTFLLLVPPIILFLGWCASVRRLAPASLWVGGALCALICATALLARPLHRHHG